MSAEGSVIHDLLVQRVLGELLSTEDGARLDAALASDPALRAEAAELERTLFRIADSVQAEPPPSLRSRVLASVEAGVAASGEARVEAPAPPPRLLRTAVPAARWPYALAASVTLLAIAMGSFLSIENRQLRREMARQQEAARMLLEPNVVMSFAMQGAGAAKRAAGLVLLDLDAKRASLSISDLPVLPEGQSYYLWAELEGQSVPCGQFRTLADGSILTQFPIPVDSYVSPIQRLVLTVETGADVAAPAGPVVMASS